MDEVKRFAIIKEKAAKASEIVIRIEERYKTERSKLEALVKSITEKGYDPSKLAEIKNTKAAELCQILDKLEKDMEDINQKISAMETSTNA